MSEQEIDDNIKDTKHPVQQYFNYDEYSKSSVCQTCKGVFKGRHSGNLLSHLKRKHRLLYNVILPTCTHFSQKKKQSKKSSVNVSYNVEDLTKSLVAWVTLDARPYSLFDDVGAKGVLEPIFEAFVNAGIDFRINRHNIVEHCEKFEQKIREEIIRQIGGKLVSTIIDVVDIQNR